MNYYNNLCPLPWIQLSANADTSLRICCNTYHAGHVLDDDNQRTSVISEESLDTLYNKKTHRDLRSAMIRGEKPDFCRSCYDTEKIGGSSVRQSFYNQHKDNVPDLIKFTNDDGSIDLENIKIKRIDFALSNICALKCRMCTPSCSSALKLEFDEVGLGYSHQEYTDASTLWRLNPSFKLIFEKHSDHVTEIFTTGGEPFLSKEHRDILKLIRNNDRHANISLTYHSSLNELPAELIELWRGFKEIHIHLSLEGVKEINEYARFPSKWDQILNNLKTLEALSREINISLIIHSCVQAITWLHHHQLFFFTKILSQRNSKIPCFPCPIWLATPYEMSALSLPIELRELGISRVEKAMEYVKRTIGRPLSSTEEDFYITYLAIFKRLRGTPFNNEDALALRARVISVDRYRKQNIVELMPDFKDFFQPDIGNYNSILLRISISQLKAKGHKALSEKNYEVAAQRFRDAWNLDKNDCESCYNIGFSLKMLERRNEASNFFRETIKLNPDHYFALVEIAWDEVRLNSNHRVALTLFKRALLNEPDFKSGDVKKFIWKCQIDRFAFWRRI